MDAPTASRRPGRSLLALLLLFLTPLAAGGEAVRPDNGSLAMRLPEEPFVENEGQLDSRVAFHARTPSGRVFVMRDGSLMYSVQHARPADGAFSPTGWALRETFLGGEVRPRGAGKTPTLVSSFIGNDPSCWREALPTYSTVEVGSPWEGIDVSLRLNEGRVEKLFRLAPGISEAAIGVRLEGARSLRLAGETLVAETGLGEVTLSAPVAYQQTRSGRTIVAAAYTLSGDRYGFRLGPRDPDLPVVIDPILNASYVGGTSIEAVRGMAVDPGTGKIYVVGTTASTDLPFITDAAQSAPNDSFVALFLGDLTALSQTTYLGGSSTDVARAVAVNPTTGEVIVAGSTTSTDFPATTTGAQSFNAGKWDAFVTRLEPSLLGINRSTYYGGAEDEQSYVALAVHPTTGRIYLTGETTSSSLLFTTGGAQGSPAGGVDAFLVGFDPALGTIVQGSFYGGAGNDFPYAMAVDAAHDGVLVSGFTSSTSLPNTFGAGQPSYSGGSFDAFVALFNLDLTQNGRSTYLGGGGTDMALAMAVASGSGDLYVAGRTNSADLQGRIGGAQSNRGAGGGDDFFVARLEPSLVLLKQATYLGGSGNDTAYAVAVEPSSGDIFVAGYSQSDDFPGRTAGAQPLLRGRGDAAAGRLNAELTSLLQSTYFGGLGDDVLASGALQSGPGALVLAGSTASPDLPGTSGGALHGLAGPSDGFVARLSLDLTGTDSPQAAVPAGLLADPTAGFYSNGNGVLEPGEVVVLQTSWKNFTHTAFDATGESSSFTGPAPGAYFLTDDVATYGTLPPGGTAGCTAAFDCYAASVTQPTARPATHWDATLLESLSTGDGKAWSVHLGNSFADVLRTHPFYGKIETLLHNGVTGGCSATAYCPSQTVSRDQMAIFIARVVAQGAANIPAAGKIDGAAYDCAPGGASLFTDVQPTDTFCRHVHYLAFWGVTRGCTSDQFCPSLQVDRGSMAAFLVRGLLGGGPVPAVRNADSVTGRSYNCQSATPNVFFTDVPYTDPFCAPIHYLWARGFIGGCGADTYCPTGLVTRDAMAKFLVNTFDLKLYGP